MTDKELAEIDRDMGEGEMIALDAVMAREVVNDLQDARDEIAQLKGYLSDRIQDTDFLRYACDQARAEGVREGARWTREEANRLALAARAGHWRESNWPAVHVCDGIIEAIAALPDAPREEEATI